ncbi:DMT family transporter [Phytoactinopolyspora endophytica]|uniref:DMT family transporter n=1 Tax=Phytoactinopolyspora endophytica TaxID=1642495 RepID=UPI00101D8674|nr:DMT family transporter [Phytoactinopolyspora endophytica]
MNLARSRSRTPSSTTLGATTCAAGMTIVGTSIAIAPSLEGYPVLAGQGWRYLLAGLILMAVLVARTPSPVPDRATVSPLRRIRAATATLTGVTLGTAIRLTAIAATGLAAFNWLLIEGTRHADPAFMAAVVGAAPLVLALLGPLAGGHRIRLGTAAGSAVVVTGIVLVHGATAAPLVAWPYAIAFLACEAAFTLLAVPVLKELTPLQLSTGTCLIAAPMLAVVSVVTQESGLQAPTATEALALLYMAVGTTAVAFLLWYSGVARLGADRAGLFIGVMPISGYLAGVAIGSSTWAIPALAGVLLCGAGIALGLRQSPRHPARSADCLKDPAHSTRGAPSPAETLESTDSQREEDRRDDERPDDRHQQRVLLDP